MWLQYLRLLNICCSIGSIVLQLGTMAPKTPNGVSSSSTSYIIRYETVDGSRSGTYIYNPSAGTQLSYILTSLYRDTEYIVQVAMRVSYSVCRYNYDYGNYSNPISFRTNATLKKSNIPVRLVYTYPGLNFLGRVEVSHNDIWGTVCDDLFGSTDANVVCQMLNFTRGALCYGTGYGQGTGQIWMDDVNCHAEDEVLDDCGFNGWGVHNCHHHEDVGVVCRPNELFPPVENVTVTNVGPTLLTIQWNVSIIFITLEAPFHSRLSYSFTLASIQSYNFSNGLYRRYYQLRYEDSRGISRLRTIYSSLTTKYTLTGLRFSEVYNVSLRVRILPRSSCYYYLYGEYSNVVSVQTVETAPTSAPTRFHLNNINSTAIEVLWELPPYNSRGGIIRGYKLFVAPANGGREAMINIRDNTTDAYVVGGLSIATAYRFSVLAFTSTGDGPRSIALIITTLRYDPLITDFGYNGNGLDKAIIYPSFYRFPRINIHCTSSNATHAPADWYFANGTRIGVRDRNFRAGHFPNGTAMLQIAHYRTLSYCDGGNYTCIINASSGHYETRNFTLIVGYSPARPGRPFVLKAQSTSITIGWSESPCDGGHPLSSFRIQYDKVYGYFIARTIRNIDPARRNYTITGLSSNTYYSFKVQAVSVNSWTSSYSITTYVYTLSPAPSAPRDVTVRLVTPRVAEVRWRVPAVTNGMITQYTVYAEPLRASRQRRQAVAVTTPQTIRMVFRGTARAGNITLTSHSITYQFRVSAAVNPNGVTLNEGALSTVTASSMLFVPEPGLPTPANVQVARLTNSSVILQWDYPPPPSEAIQNFLVSYSADVEFRSPQGVLILFKDSGEVTATTNRITVGTLVPESNYQFQVSAVTTSGRGAEVSVNGQTRLSYDNFKLAYFQVRIGPIQSCIEFMDLSEEGSKDNLINVHNGLAQELAHLCPTCRVTTANIKDDEFSCRGGLTKQIVYRARIVGTDVYSAPGLVSLMQSWVGSGKASIMVQSSRFHLDSTCSTNLDTLKAPDCQGGGELGPVSPRPSEPVTKPRVASQAARSGANVGEIGGIAVGAVIIALLVVLIVLVIFVMIRKWKSKLTISNIHSRMKESGSYADSPFANIGSNRNSAICDDIDSKDDLKKTSSGL